MKKTRMVNGFKLIGYQIGIIKSLNPDHVSIDLAWGGLMDAQYFRKFQGSNDAIRIRNRYS
jgi:hypothetical protein